MSKRSNVLIGALAAVLVAGLARPAAASAGNGIRLGGSEGRLHPYLDLETRYDSNLYYASPGVNVADGILHVRPGVLLAVPGETTAVDLRAELDWAQYLGLEGKTSNLSQLYGDAALSVGVNRHGTLGLELTDGFQRNANTSSFSLGSALISNENELRVAVPWTPGGGALVLTLGGEWQLVTYEPYLDGTLCTDPNAQCNSTTLSKLGWNELRGTGEVRWKFLPRTAWVLDGGYFSRLPENRTLSAKVSGFRVSTGLSGLVTSRLVSVLKGGFGQASGDVSFNTWLATAELEWLLSETSSARLGYMHDLGADSGTLLSVYQSNRVYADAHVLLAGRFTGRLGGSWERRSYAHVAADATLLRIEPAIEAEVTRWLRASLGYAYTDRTSKFPADMTALPGYAYSKNEVWLRSTFTY